jgi:hypothetical protein
MNVYLCSESGPAEPPTSYLWSLYLSAQHYNRIGQSLKALELIDAAIEHTPTEVQLYMMKAKILKVCGGYFQTVRQITLDRMRATFGSVKYM